MPVDFTKAAEIAARTQARVQALTASVTIPPSYENQPDRKFPVMIGMAMEYLPRAEAEALVAKINAGTAQLRSDLETESAAAMADALNPKT